MIVHFVSEIEVVPAAEEDVVVLLNWGKVSVSFLHYVATLDSKATWAIRALEKFVQWRPMAIAIAIPIPIAIIIIIRTTVKLSSDIGELKFSPFSAFRLLVLR